MNFETWDEAWDYIEENATASCLTCRYGGRRGKPSAHIFCVESISMVNLNMMIVCAKWTDKDGKTLKDFDDDAPLWKNEVNNEKTSE